MMERDSRRSERILRSLPWQTATLAALFAFNTGVNAQVIFTENFTGGASTAGFTIGQVAGACTWTYDNPGGQTITGAGFDGDFAIFDSDFCGSGSDSSAANLISPPFDASSGNFLLHFSQQYQDLSGTMATVDVWNGTAWTTVYSPVGADVGYPDPALPESVNITGAAGGSAVAQIRFHFAGDWRWWWAVDNISVEAVDCIYPSDLAVTAITTGSATIGWTNNGSAGYEWAVTTGAMPDGTNSVASGNGSQLGITGLNSGTPYTAWVRSDCGGGTFSPWSNGTHFATGITNDECTGAIMLTVNPNYNCGAVTPGTVVGATGSGVTSICSGTADDDVWFTFTATDTLHRISLIDITGSTTDMYMALWSGSCGNLTLVPNSCSDNETLDIGGLTPGITYYLQVYTWTEDPGQTSAFNVCIGTEPFCQPPLNITLTSIATPDASVSWTDNGAMGYQYELRVSGDAGSGPTGLVDASIVTGSPLAFTGLVADSLYTLYVRSICSEGDTSSWSDGLAIFDGYCNTIDFTSSVEPICNVTFAGIDNSTSDVVGATPALEDFTNLIAIVAQGGMYAISATGNSDGDYTNYITAFFDWDHNNSFETMVPLGSFTNSDCDSVITTMVTVPVDAALGETRMRVVKNYFLAPMDPCETYSYGQAEDYTVHVDIGEGITDVSALKNLSVYPNPASTELFINTTDSKPVHVKVYDMVGHLAMEQNMAVKLDITGLAPGSYSVQILDEKGAIQAHARFIKQ